MLGFVRQLFQEVTSGLQRQCWLVQ